MLRLEEICENNTNISRPMVSVGMLTYNHGKYVADAIESILMQSVNFSYDIVICDDCSTDNTRDILIQYKNKYPNIIKLYLNEQNIGAQKNANKLRTLCRGKYRATLEGDDYWIKTSKLQSQVDFLESHPDFIAIGGDFTCIDEKGKSCPFPWGDIKYTYCQGDEYTLKDLENWLLPAHASCMCFRNIFIDCSKEELDYFHSLKILGDRRTSMYLLMQGRIRHQNEVMMVRRVLTNSNTSMTSLTKRTNWHTRNYIWMIETERCVKEHFHKNIDLTPFKDLRWKSSLKVLALSPSISNFKLMMYIYRHSDNKKRYRKIAFEQIQNAYNKSVDECGRIKTIKKILKKILKMIKFVLLCPKRVHNSEKALYSKSLGIESFF